MVIQLNKKGYDPFIDYLKGICILMVIINHGSLSLCDYLQYPLWVFEAVPIFLLLQVFHVYKKPEPRYPNLNKLWKRIIRPFFIVEFIIFLLGILTCILKSQNILSYIHGFIMYGGGGPGSYYVWVYLQFAFLVPLLYKLVRNKYGLAIFICGNIAVEFLLSITNFPEILYRLLCFRYLFLIYIGYIWVEKGIVLNRRTLFLSILSIVAILILYNTHKYWPNVSFSPFVFETEWRTFHWFTYFLPGFLLPVLIFLLYSIGKKYKVNKFIIFAGKKSYEIFLFQMIVFAYFPLSSGFIKMAVCLLPLLFYRYRDLRYGV